jgi:hypothetical protein
MNGIWKGSGVDQLVEEWEGTVPGLLQRMGKDWGQLSKVPSKGGKSYQLKQEGEWWIIMLTSFRGSTQVFVN